MGVLKTPPGPCTSTLRRLRAGLPQVSGPCQRTLRRVGAPHGLTQPQQHPRGASRRPYAVPNVAPHGPPVGPLRSRVQPLAATATLTPRFPAEHQALSALAVRTPSARRCAAGVGQPRRAPPSPLRLCGHGKAHKPDRTWRRGPCWRWCAVTAAHRSHGRPRRTPPRLRH